MFILGTPTQIYKFLAPSEREKTTWVKKLKTYIEKEKQAFVEVKHILMQISLVITFCVNVFLLMKIFNDHIHL